MCRSGKRNAELVFDIAGMGVKLINLTLQQTMCHTSDPFPGTSLKWINLARWRRCHLEVDIQIVNMYPMRVRCCCAVLRFRVHSVTFV